MKSPEVGKDLSPYEDVHIKTMMAIEEFKELPEEIQTLTRQILVLAEKQSVGITQSTQWPAVLLPQVARLRAGEKENVRFLNPFSFLARLEEFLINARRQKRSLT